MNSLAPQPYLKTLPARAAFHGKTTGDWEVLKWVLLNGQWDVTTVLDAVHKAKEDLWMLDHPDVIPLIKQCGTSIVSMAVRNEHLAVLERCEKEGFVLDETTWKEAAKWGSVKVCKWLRDRFD